MRFSQLVAVVNGGSHHQTGGGGHVESFEDPTGQGMWD